MEPRFPLKMPQHQDADSHRVGYRLSLASNSVVAYHHNQAPKVLYRLTTYYPTFDKVLLEMKSRFQSHDQDILCALAEVVSKTNTSTESLALVSSFYGLDMEILTAEKEIFQNCLQKNPAEIKHASSVIKFMFQNGLHEVLPVLYKVCTILTTIPATSCSAERSFSDLRRIKTYLRSTMRQDRLSSLALICIERAYANRTLENDMENIIDIFGKRKKSLFCTDYGYYLWITFSVKL